MPSEKDNIAAQNAKYNEALAFLHPNPVMRSDRNFVKDLNNSADSFHYILANWMQHDPEFYKALNPNDIYKVEQIVTPFNNDLNKLIEDIYKQKEQLESKIGEWQAKLSTASDENEKTIQAHIAKLTALLASIEQIHSQISITDLDSNALVAKQKAIIKVQEELNERMKADVELRQIFDIVPASTLVVDIEAIKRYVDTEKLNRGRNKEAPDFENSLVLKSEHIKEQLKKRGISKETYDLASDLFRTIKKSIDGKTIEEEIDPSQRRFIVSLNGQEFPRDQLQQKRSENPLFNTAADYFDTAMQDVGAIFLRNALLAPSLVASKTKLSFIEKDNEMYFVSKCEDYTYEKHERRIRFIPDIVTKHTIPGKVTTVYKFNKNPGQEGFELVALHGSNKLLNDMLSCQIVGRYENLTEEKLKEIQKEECLKALVSLRKTVQEINDTLPRYAAPVLNAMCDLIEKMKERPDANLELLTKTAETTEQYAQNPTVENANALLALAPQIDKEYDASGKMLAYLIVSLFITVSVLAFVFTGGIAELFLVAMVGEVVAEALVTIAGLAIGVGASAAGVVKYEQKRWMTHLYDKVTSVPEAISSQITSKTQLDSSSSSSSSTGLENKKSI